VSDIALDNNPASGTYRDLLIYQGDLQLVGQTYGTQADAILQHILQRLREFLGECFVSLNDGMPYYQRIFVSQPDQGQIDSLFINQILGTPGVIQLNKYSFNIVRATRVLVSTFSAQTTAGLVNYSGLV
jgi:hypothetical protein